MSTDSCSTSARQAEVHGLIINRFGVGGTDGQGGSGIVVNANARVVIQGNYIGTDVTGTVALRNATGVLIDAGANNTIGGAPRTAI